MKKFTYPVVVYHDEDNNMYLMHIEELGIYGMGETLEECNDDLYGSLKSYITTALLYEMDIPEAQSFNSVIAKNPNKKVMLMTISMDEKKLKSIS